MDVTNGNLDRLERLGKIVQTYGTALLLALFVSLYSGWVPSPMLAAVQATTRSVETHDARVAGVILARGASDRQLAETLKLLTLQLKQQTRVLQVIGCSNVKDADLRRTCLIE
jgi:hypothetical protein